MNKNKSVEELFQIGYKEAIYENNLCIAKEREQQRIWLEQWAQHLKAGQARIPEKEIAKFLVITDERYTNHMAPPDELSRSDFSIVIDEYAPIKVIFDHPHPSVESKVVDVTYKVPRIEFDEENDKLVFWWSLRGDGYRGTQTQWITSLPRALYEARCMQKRLHEFQKELDLKVEAKKEPVYVPIGETIDDFIHRRLAEEVAKEVIRSLQKVNID